MKKIKYALIYVLSLVLAVALTVVGTVAYLQDEEGAVNVMTVGNVYIEQIEQERDQNGNLVPFTQAKPAYPAVGPIEWADSGVMVNGTEYKMFTPELKNVDDKIVTVKNTGKSEAYVRTIIAFECPDYDPDGFLHINVNDEGITMSNWVCTEINGVEYCIAAFTYDEALKPGTTSAPSLLQVFLDSKADNEYCEAHGDTLDILVVSQAVQTAGFDNAETALDVAFGDITTTNHPWDDEAPVLPAVVDNAADLATAINNGGLIILADDINLGSTQLAVPSGKSVVIDLNGNDIDGEYADEGHYAMFTIPADGSLTVKGEGNVITSTEFTASNRSGSIFLNSGKLTIEGGKYNLSDSTTGQTWIIATIVDNRTNGAACQTVLTINGGEFSLGGNAKNLFRNYPQQGGSATINFNGGVFKANGTTTTYIWNQEAGSYPGMLNFNGGTYDSNVVYEDYFGQSDITIADGVVINAYSGNN